MDFLANPIFFAMNTCCFVIKKYFFNPHPRIFFIIDFRERRRDREREKKTLI